MAVTNPSLRVRDLANGTQAIGAISSSTAGTTNTVYAQAVEGTGSGAWVSLGSRVGNGEITLTPGKGYWWFHVVSSDGSNSALSNIVYRKVTDGSDPVLLSAWDGLVARFQQLELTGIPRHRIYKKQTLELYEGMEFPCIVVSPESGSEQEGVGTNESDEIAYPFQVVIVDADDDDFDSLAKRLTWRAQLMKACRNQKLAGATLVKTVKVRPGQMIGSKIEDAHIFWSAFEASALADELRGLS